jgi:hypothetical protein
VSPLGADPISFVRRLRAEAGRDQRRQRAQTVRSPDLLALAGARMEPDRNLGTMMSGAAARQHRLIVIEAVRVGQERTSRPLRARRLMSGSEMKRL